MFYERTFLANKITVFLLNRKMHLQPSPFKTLEIWALSICLTICCSSVNAAGLDRASALFQHGVASGDPMPNQVIIWTRITPKNTGTVAGSWLMSTDVTMNQIVKSGKFNTTET